MKLISTRTHGLIDYLSVGALFLLPRLFGWPNAIRRTLDTVSAVTLLYSLLTRYELGVVRVLPFRAHLGLDAIHALLMLLSPLMFPFMPRVTRVLTMLGLGEVGVVLMSDPEPRDELLFRADEVNGALREDWSRELF